MSRDLCDTILVKYDPNGNTQWMRTYDCGDNDLCWGIATDKNNNVIITGQTEDGVGGSWMSVIKYDTNGNTLWIRTYDCGGEEIGFCAVTDASNNVIVGGYANKGSDPDVLVIKYDSSGNTVWLRKYDTGVRDEVKGIAIDANNDIIVAGLSEQALVRSSYLLIKYNANGDTEWVRKYEGGRDDWGMGVAVDLDNNIIVTGYSFPDTFANYLTIKCEGAPIIPGTPNNTQPPLSIGEVIIYSTGDKGIVHANLNERAIIRFKPTTTGKIAVDIYTLDGSLVWQDFKDVVNPDDSNNYIEWQCINNEGLAVAAGVYMIAVEGPGIKTIKKIIVIR